MPYGIDNDKDVDFEDFAILANHWLDTNCNIGDDWCGRADIQEDGKVDMGDLSELATHWLESSGS